MNYRKQLDTVYEDAVKRLSNLVAEYGKKSNVGVKTLRITDDTYCYNVNGTHWLFEVADEKIFDNHGYEYYITILSYEQVCDLADYFVELYVTPSKFN